MYHQSAGDKVYHWTDAGGGVHFGDTPPALAAVENIREVEIESFNESTVNQEHYSIAAQAGRMAEQRRQLEEERFNRLQIRLEEKRIAEEREVIRLNELLRKQGYGQRPNGFPFAQSFSFF